MVIKKILLILIISYCCVAQGNEELIESSEAVDAFEYVNHLRIKAGMTGFSKNKLLDKAAYNHASYCHSNNIGGHFESNSHSGFTGYDHVERINFVKYNSRSTGENVSSHKGGATDKNSVDGLMSAIYHRFGFLSFDYDEVGIGTVRNDNSSSYVYNMGNVLKNEMCLRKSSNKPGKYYSSVCRDKKFRISGKEFDAASSTTQKNNPDVVIWPAANSYDVPPAFFEESPDPLPNYSVSGYPVSIQFNPSAFPNTIPVVTNFELIDVESELSVEIIKRLDKRTDHNKKFSEYEHAIFPLNRLGWSKQYRAELTYVVSGNSEIITWLFNTRDLNVTTYEVRSNQEVIKEKSNNVFAVYLPPRHRNDAELSYSTKYRGLSKLDIKIVDGNTLLIKAVGNGDAEVSFHGMSFKIKI